VRERRRDWRVTAQSLRTVIDYYREEARWSWLTEEGEGEGKGKGKEGKGKGVIECLS
jgi:hypothetical protein